MEIPLTQLYKMNDKSKMKEAFIKLLKDVVSSTPIFKPIIKNALFRIGNEEKRVSIVLTENFFNRISTVFQIVRKSIAH